MAIYRFIYAPIVRSRLLTLVIAVLCSTAALGQYSQYHKVDSAEIKYPYRFPLLGEKAVKKGFDLPYPFGGMLNFFTAKQDITIPEVAVGFTGNGFPAVPLTDVTDLVEFGTVNARATSINVRPDLWVLPFLDVYGIFGKSYAQTTVELTSPFNLKAVADLEGTSLGMGVTGAGGFDKYFFVLDGNWIWTKMSNFKDPVRSAVFSARLGRAFKISKAPESNLAWWMGAMRVNMGGVTEGSVTLNEILPPETWAKKDEIVSDYWNWYDNEATLAQKLIADKVLTPIVEKIDAADGTGAISYRIRKTPKRKWNMLIGGQYQVNKHHQVRGEIGLIGNRKSLLLSYNYRFGFKTKSYR